MASEHFDPLTQDRSWRKRLYEAYVSSGQAGSADASNSVFLSRAPAIKSIIATHLPEDKNAPILDLGCGHGAFLFFLMQAGYQNLCGVDVSAEQVALAKRLGVPTVEQYELNSYLERTESSSVSVVLLMDVLEHLTMPELFDTLDEVFRVLKPGGKCIAHVPNAEGLFGMRIRYGDLTHETAFTPKSMSQLFRTIGFDKVQCYEDRPVIHNLKSFARRVIWDTCTLWPRLVLAAETGLSRFILSQNMLAVAIK